MLISKGLGAVRALQRLQQPQQLVKQSVRNSHGPINYRCAPPDPNKRTVLIAELVQGFAWWWVLWHLWTEPGHILGEFEYPDPSKWTDEELGIPPK